MPGHCGHVKTSPLALLQPSVTRQFPLLLRERVGACPVLDTGVRGEPLARVRTVGETGAPDLGRVFETLRRYFDNLPAQVTGGLHPLF